MQNTQHFILATCLVVLVSVLVPAPTVADTQRQETVHHLTKKEARSQAALGDRSLSLSMVQTMNVAIARILARSESVILLLPGLRVIDADVTEALGV